MEDYTKSIFYCPKQTSLPFKHFFLTCIRHISAQNVLLLVLTVPMYTTQSSTQKSYHVPMLILPVLGRVRATSSFKDLITVAKENTSNQTADILVEDQPLDLVRVSQDRELHKPMSKTEHVPSIVLIIQHVSSIILIIQHVSSIMLIIQHVSSIILIIQHVSSIILIIQHVSSIILIIQHVSSIILIIQHVY